MRTTPRTPSTIVAILLATASTIAGAAGCGGGDEPKAPTAPAAPSAPSPPVAGKPAAKPADAAPVSGFVESPVVTATAKVTAVDVETRLVTMQRPDGSTLTIRAGEAVRNLPQVKVGDDVTVAYHESVAFEVSKPGESKSGASGAFGAEVVGRAKEGEKPGAAAGRVVQITATIVNLDKESMRVTLKGPDGTEVTVRARDPEKIARVAIGDLVEITYTEAMAIAVTTAPAAK